ncbi:hypothetical protein Nepgr_021806 [Nepenthes gracilis]|uniref:MATH domain-containing protein n=1 Tax=Nepenthes gracilis TaxID=150966 RepID=A0AAD3XXJ6_NEPGR|nr:hypothetical protein Nepgr_021806 [Nepenthes gracilis]
MAGIVNEESAVGRSLVGISNEQQCLSGEALAEWRSCEQVVNGTPSISPPYWDTEDSDDDGGPKPPELYGRHTWKIEKFSQINKRELRSNEFEVGGYKWYILIYPQGCDVCNHLSLFLCVANHDKLLPGWSHFAQFTIAVVNKDPKKSKYSDTLHRFCKKEHDWGWKKFMELSKVSDGFIDADTLIIKAQVQVIREKADRLFRCLDYQYRRELVRVYLPNVELLCRDHVEERRGSLGKLLEDKTRWSGFCAFWLGMDQNSRRRMSREKMDMILKVIVKQFFIEKEVTSTLVMDSLYSGLKALEGQSKQKKVKGKLLDGEDTPAPIVRIEKNMFVLVDDVLLLLERAAMEPLPPKDEKGPQNRMKDGGAGEDFNKDSIERDERRLTELGRRTVEIFVLAHIFSNKIEVAYQEAVALKRQEELIREEEAAGLAESEQKVKRGVAEKEKKSKKKQGKQKRNNRKGKDKVKDENTSVAGPDKQVYGIPIDDEKDLVETQTILEKDDVLVDLSDVSDSVDCAADMLQLDSEDRDTSPANWETDTSEVHPAAEVSSGGVSSCISTLQNGADKRSSSLMDDSSSTCSTDSSPSVVMNGSYRGYAFTNSKSQRSTARGKNQRGKATSEEVNGISEADSQSSKPVADRHHNDVSPSGKAAESNGYQIKRPELTMVNKEEDVMLMQRKASNKDQVDTGHSKEKTSVVSFLPRSPTRISNSTAPLKSDSKSDPVVDLSPLKKTSSNSSQQTDKAPSPMSMSHNTSGSRHDSLKVSSPKPVERLSGQQTTPMMSRPSGAPFIPGSKPTAPAVSIVQAASTAAPLSRLVSADCQPGPDPSLATHSYVPQSYVNTTVGNSVDSSSAGFTHHLSPSSMVNPSPTFAQQPALMSAPVFLPQGSERLDANCINLGISCHWKDSPHRDASRNMTFDSSSMLNEVQKLDLHGPVNRGSHVPLLSSDFPVSTSGRQAQGVLGDEFPHLDIINDLLNDEHQGGGSTSMETAVFWGLGNRPNLLNQQFTLPSDMGVSDDMVSSASSCRLERSRSYIDDGFQRDVCSSHFDTPREFIPHADLMSYSNGYFDGVAQNHWQAAAPDLSFLSMRNSGVGNGYQLNVRDYLNQACGMSGYTMFRPSNGY